jgi:hypothetical protein
MVTPTAGWGYNADTEIIFPMRVASKLRNARGPAWRDLVDQVVKEPEASLAHLGFTLLFVRLSGCLTCHTDSYRAMRGCTACSIHAIRRFRGDDKDLIALYERAKEEVEEFLKLNSASPREEVSKILGDRI